MMALRFHLAEEPAPLCRTRWHAAVTDALAAHPWRTADPAAADLLFPGFDSGDETNWPLYGNQRSAVLVGVERYMEHFRRVVPERIAALPSLPPGRFHVVFDMGPRSGFPERFAHRRDLVMALGSATEGRFRVGQDVAFPASAILRFDREGVASNAGTRLVVFMGADTHPLRRQLATLDDGRDVVIRLKRDRAYFGRASIATPLADPAIADYAELLQGSRFGFVVRGDAPFSYRLLETMAAGAIPVVLSDGWVLPFGEVVDWGAVAVRVPESEWASVVERLRAIPDETVLAMRRSAIAAYRRHFATIERQVDTLLTILARRHAATAGIAAGAIAGSTNKGGSP